MTALWMAFIGVAVLLSIPIWSMYRSSKLVWVRVDGKLICVGAGKKTQKIEWTDIVELSVAPLYDVYPFDDLWTLKGKNSESVSFLSRESGADRVLTHLESVLTGFRVATSITQARENAVFEQPVMVWRAPELRQA